MLMLTDFPSLLLEHRRTSDETEPHTVTNACTISTRLREHPNSAPLSSLQELQRLS